MPNGVATPSIETMADHSVLACMLTLEAPRNEPSLSVPEFRLSRHAPIRVRWCCSAEPDQAAEDEAKDEERWIDNDESHEGEADGPDAGSIAEPILPDGYKVTLNI